MEKAGYVLLSIVALIYAGAVLFGLIAIFPWGIVGFIAIVGVGLLFARVVADRLGSKEDDHYSQNVER